MSFFTKSRGIYHSVMHRWLRAFTCPALTETLPDVTAFAELRVAEPSPSTAPMVTRGPAAPISPGMGDIELLSGRRIRLCSEVDPDTSRRLVAALESTPRAEGYVTVLQPGHLMFMISEGFTETSHALTEAIDEGSQLGPSRH